MDEGREAWTRPWPAAADDAAIAAAERALGRTLPPAYAAFLRRTNGGRPAIGAFQVRGIATAATMLFGVGTGDDYAIDRANELLSMMPLPGDVVAVGEDPGGNLIVIGTDGPNAGAVGFFAFCGWPLGDDPEVIGLAPDFDAFLGLLVDPASVPAGAWSLDYAGAAAAGGHPEWGHHPPPGYSWHLEPPATLQLVPRDIHWMAPHVSSTRR